MATLAEPLRGAQSARTRFSSRGGANALAGAPGRAIGQSFAPAGDSLARLDIQVRRRGDARPGRLRIYAWRGAYADTIRQPPLFEDAFELGGTSDWQLRSFFPRLEVEPGQPYFFELSAPDRGPFSVRASRPGAEDAYPRGRLFEQRRRAPPDSGRDLWFRTFGVGEPRLAAATASRAVRLSDPELRFEAPEPPGAPAERADYCERVAGLADEGRAEALRGCGAHAHVRAAWDAALYRLSCERGDCDEAHARAAADLLSRAFARWSCEFPGPEDAACAGKCRRDHKVGFAWLEPPALAYSWIRASPSLSPEEHRRFREMLLDAARRSWPRRERGSFNRPIKSALGLRVVADLFPDAAEAPEWRAYGEGVFQDFWGPKDTEEDSSTYAHGVWWPALLGYLEASGLADRAWSDPDFRALVARERERVLPVGAAARFGDDVGWAYGQPGLIWLFEVAAVRLSDPTYRWWAQRLFDHQRARARDHPPGDDSLGNHMLYLARACLDARDEPAPEPPTPRREVVAAEEEPGGDPLVATPGAPVGRVLPMTASPLVRIDLRVREARGGVRASLFRWKGDAPATRSSPPVFVDRLRSADGVQSLHPLVASEPGERFYLELEPEPGAGRAVFEASSGGLWLRAYTLEGEESVVTTRRAGRSRNRDEWGTPPRYFELEDRIVPDKLVLRSGHAPEDLVAVFNLLAGYGHGHRELGALAALSEGGAVLLSQTAFPYARHSISPDDESAPVLRRYYGGSLGEPGRSVEVERFVDGRSATLAVLAFEDPFGWKVRQERRILLLRNRLLWVRDGFRFPEPMGAAAGPVWHASEVWPAHGANWFDLAMPEPLGNVWKFRNPERHLLLWFLPRAASEVSVQRVASYGPPPGCEERVAGSPIPAECRFSPEFVLAQRRVGELAAGESLQFDSVLLPHGPEQEARELAQGIRVLHDDGRAAALEAVLGDETWVMVDNPEGTPIAGPELETDATLAIVRLVPGRPAYLLALDATRLRVATKSWTWPARSSVEYAQAPAPLESE